MLITLFPTQQHFLLTEICGVLACIYLEFLESGPFKYIIPSNSNYFRYIDDIQLIYPQELRLVKITDGLKKIEPT